MTIDRERSSGKAIPDAVLLSHTAVLGKTGSGKTSTAKLVVEQLDGFRVCILDPIKSDWWGITSSADGRRPGLPFKILGGPHGHVPLHSSAGKVIGSLVGSGEVPLSIVDMADFEAGGQQRFFVDFAQALWKSVRGVVYLVIEEAHEFAPKERAGFGQENLAIHWAKKLATGSRTKGIRLVVATHRIQSLHNAVLGSCETLIAHRIMAPADQEPVIKWLRANLKDKGKREEVEGSLASLPTGTGWLCSGEAQIFERVAFPRIKTYDNTATPMHDGASVSVATAPVDVGELRALIGEAVAQAEANDPITLKAKIADLERKLAGTEMRLTTAPRLSDIEIERRADAAHVQGFDKGFGQGWREAMSAIDSRVRDLEATLLLQPPTRQDTSEGPALRGPAALRPPCALPPLPRSDRPKSGGLPKGQQAILDALYWWRVSGKDAPSMAQIAFVAGYSHKSSTFDTLRSRLRSAGLIEYPDPGHMRLTAEGAKFGVAPPRPPSMMDYHDRVRGKLTTPMQKFFDALIGRKTLTLDQLGEATGYSAASSTFDTLRSRLKSLDLIIYPERGKVRIADWLYP